MQNQVITASDSLMSAFTTFMNYVPTLIGAAIVIAVGWFLSSLIARLLQRVLHVARLDEVALKAGVDRYMVGPRGLFPASYGVAELAKWFIRLVFLQAAANLLNMPQVTAIINSILYFIPNLAVALVILVIGAYAAQFASGLAREGVAKSGVGSPRLFGMITQYSIIGFAVIAALNHIGVAVVLVNTLFMGLVASLSLAIGLAFGLGGQGVASEVTRTWYARAKAPKSRVEIIPSSSTIERPDESKAA
jgi:hypothetical protein